MNKVLICFFVLLFNIVFCFCSQAAQKFDDTSNYSISCLNGEAISKITQGITNVEFIANSIEAICRSRGYVVRDGQGYQVAQKMLASISDRKEQNAISNSKSESLSYKCLRDEANIKLKQGITNFEFIVNSIASICRSRGFIVEQSSAEEVSRHALQLGKRERGNLGTKASKQSKLKQNKELSKPHPSPQREKSNLGEVLPQEPLEVEKL